MQNIIDLISLIAIAALPTWSRFRVWRVRSSFLKWGSVGLAAVLAIAVSSVSALLIPGMVKQHARSTPIPDPFGESCWLVRSVPAAEVAL